MHENVDQQYGDYDFIQNNQNITHGFCNLLLQLTLIITPFHDISVSISHFVTNSTIPSI